MTIDKSSPEQSETNEQENITMKQKMFNELVTKYEEEIIIKYEETKNIKLSDRARPKQLEYNADNKIGCWQQIKP